MHNAEYFGQSKKTSLTAHGLVRIVYPGNFMAECQYKDGEYHGFFRSIFNDGSHLVGCKRDGYKYGQWRWYDPEGEL